jgi:hypothetical protein
MKEIKDYNSKEPVPDSHRTRAGLSPSMISHSSVHSSIVPFDLKKLR